MLQCRIVSLFFFNKGVDEGTSQENKVPKGVGGLVWSTRVTSRLAVHENSISYYDAGVQRVLQSWLLRSLVPFISTPRAS